MRPDLQQGCDAAVLLRRLTAMAKHGICDPDNRLPHSCAQCCREIPYSPESADYVLAFCDSDCFRKWSENNRQRRPEAVFVQSPEGKQGDPESPR